MESQQQQLLHQDVVDNDTTSSQSHTELLKNVKDSNFSDIIWSVTALILEIVDLESEMNQKIRAVGW